MPKEPTKIKHRPVIRAFRIPPKLWQELTRIARKNRRSTASELIVQLEFALHNLSVGK